ncbi:MAG: TonB-dependent receptor [Opitutae bacterium]|nr:TonB-dependent receptor [Opitutae bacterium]
MTTLSHPRVGAARYLRTPLVFLFMLGFAVLGFAADAVKKNFDIAADDAARALKQFAAQSGEQLLYSPSDVAGVKTLAIKGELTAREALAKMLEGTALVVAQDKSTGALAVRRETSEESKNAVSRPADAAAANVKVKDGTVQLNTFEVRERRIDGLNNKGLLQGGANAPLYHDVVTREDIERMGVTSLEELFRVIPQTSAPTTAIQEAVNNSQFTGGATINFSTVGLRGFESGQTVILVNGRALPRTGESDSDGPDLSRIPLASIERVEILPYAGSAIYGAGAIGGAINIILRKEYTGKDLTLYTGTTTDGGGSEYRVSYVDGRSFNHGKGNLTLTFSYVHRDTLLASDRDYLDRALQRFSPNGGPRTASGQLAFEQFMLPALAGAPGVIVVGSSGGPTMDLGIPGAPGARYAMIPAGTSPAASFSLTPASFASTANKFSNGGRLGRSVLYEPLDSYSLNAQVEHEFIKDRLSSYGEFTVGYNRKSYSYPQALSVDLAADDPLNPFRTDVTPGFVGRPVTIYFDAVDVPDSSALYKSDYARAVVGLKGKLSEKWEWSADGVIDYSHNTVRSLDTTTTIASLNAPDSFYAPPGMAPAATRRLVYPLLADHQAFPNSPADTTRYFQTVRTSSVHGLQKEGNARVSGDLWELPAGVLKLSAITKYQKWSFTSGGATMGASEISPLLTNTDASTSGNNSRSIWQNAVEFSVPVIGPQWRPIRIESFELQGSASYETDTTVSNTSNGLFSPMRYVRHADSEVIAGKIQLTPDVAFRASYSTAFYPPGWSAVTQPQFSFPLPGLFPDAARGNTIQSEMWTLSGGGNPNLLPEHANSQNYGVIFTPRFLPGFTLNIDYWKIAKKDAVTYPDFFATWSNPAYAYAVKRAAATSADQALGWPGVVTEISIAPFNAARVNTEGVDFRLRYLWKTEHFGSLTFNANGSFTNNFYQQLSPTSEVINQINEGGAAPLKWRGLGSVTWSKGKWATTATARYVGHYYSTFTNPSPVYPNAVPLDGGRIPAYLHWDFQVSYEIPASTGKGTWRDILAGTKWTLGVNNVLDEKPAFQTGIGTSFAGSAFYSTYDDPRQRLVYLSIKKSL